MPSDDSSASGPRSVPPRPTATPSNPSNPAIRSPSPNPVLTAPPTPRRSPPGYPPAPPPEDEVTPSEATAAVGPRRPPAVPPPPPASERRPPETRPPEGRMEVRRHTGSGPIPVASRKFFPAQPRTLQEAELTNTMVEELILKAIFFAGELRGAEIAQRIKLPTAIVDEVIENLRRQKLIDIRGGGAQGLGRSSTIFVVTTFAQDLLRQILDRNRYNGPAPITLNTWSQATVKQTVRGNRIQRARMLDSFGDLVIRDYIFDGIGPAMNSGKAIFFYGPPGNGKTAICQGMVNCYDGEVFVPYALLIDDFIIRVYDPNIHKALPDEDGVPAHDGRWVRCRRPLVVVGGELTLDMLDLTYSPEVKYYEAPFQMKASNGMLLIDDFGRQKVAPKDLLNRWIVPLESEVDYLTLHTGKKIQVPFDVFAAFSTNLDPKDLVDDAFLRRVRYKLEVQRPDEEQFHQIFQIVCARRGVPYDPDLVQYLIDTHYKPNNRPFAACQPRDLLEQVIDTAHYRGVPPELRPEFLDAAVRGYFTRF